MPTTYNQVTIPAFMYGTAWKKDETARLVRMAVDAGFKAIDTANQLKHYREDFVGEALFELFNSGLKRDTLFLQTKFTSVDGQDHRLPYERGASITNQVLQSMDSSLAHLHTDYVDSYVLHGPYSGYGLLDQDWEAWAAIESLYQSGKTRMIGVSNVSAEQLAELCAKAKTKPMVVQNRCYAIAGWDKDVREICAKYSIIYEGFSLLTANPHVLNTSLVQNIAKRLGTGPAQVVFRFSMQIGMLPLTGTTNKFHMTDDLAAENLVLTADEIERIENIAVGSRHF
jgi:diketogulonate reductase-like aldo/keto reductase